MNKNLKSYFECKRCFYQCYQKSDMIKHLNKKKPCIRSPDSFLKYKDEDIYNFSLIRIKISKNNGCSNPIVGTGTTEYQSLSESFEKDIENKNDEKEDLNHFTSSKISVSNILTPEESLPEFSEIFKCNICNKIFTQRRNLIRHEAKYCKENIECENINITNNITQNITNTHNNIINIQILKSFDEDYEDSKIDNKSKVILLLANSKYTKTLENLLDNEMNLNVLIDNCGDKGLIYNKDNFEIMDIKDIAEKSMDKLYNQLNKFHKEIEENNEFSIQKHFLDEEKKVIEQKYNDYKINENVRNKVTSFIKDIYNKKKDETIKICNDIILKDEIEDVDEGY